MIVCIDQPLPVDRFNVDEVAARDDTNRVLQMIHGGGTEWNTANRWFDKTVQVTKQLAKRLSMHTIVKSMIFSFFYFPQFIFSPDGVSGICYEHSPAEGIVLVQIIEKALENVGRGAPRRRSLLDDRRGSNSSIDGEPMRSTKNEPFPSPKRLVWKIDDDIRDAIRTAGSDLDR